MRNRILKSVVLLIAVIASFISMQCKEGWHIDEIATLGLANGSQYGYITAYDDTQYGRGAFIKEFLIGDSVSETIEKSKDAVMSILKGSGTVREAYLSYRDGSTPIWKSGEEYAAFLQAEEGFSLLDVYINQALDTHPPVYYLFIRLAYSLYSVFGGAAFTLWPAWVVNMVFLCGCCLMFFRIGEKRLGSLPVGLISAAFFSLCTAGISLGMYMRMYMALCFFVLWSCDAVMAYRMQTRKSRAVSWQIILSCALGFMTHYYYAIWAIMMTAVVFIDLASRKQFRRGAALIGKMAIGACISLVLWPFSVVHLLFSNRGAESLSQDLMGNVLDNIKVFFAYCYGHPIIGTALTLVVFLIGYIICREKKVYREALIPIIGSLAALAVICFIAPYDDIRYLAPCVPAGAMFAAVGIWALTDRISKAGFRQAAAISLAVIVASSTTFVKHPCYTYEGSDAARIEIEKAEGLPCVYLTSTGAAFYREMPYFGEFSKVLILAKDEIGLLETDEVLASADRFVLFIHDSYSQTNTMHVLEELLPFTLEEQLAHGCSGLDARVYIMCRN